MPRLKNRQESVPGGFQWLQPETGYEAPSGRSFRSVVDSIIAHRRGNPWLLKKHNWQTDWEAVADEVDDYNARRLQSNPRFHHFIDESGGSSFSSPFQFPNQGRQGIAAGVKKTVAGVKVLLRWLGSSGKSVEKPLAESRAATCTVCPKNQKGDWKTWFSEEASREILAVFGIMRDLKLATSRDSELGVCTACLCPLKSKVWAELRHIAAELSPEVKAELNQENPRCWILTEIESKQ